MQAYRRGGRKEKRRGTCSRSRGASRSCPRRSSSRRNSARSRWTGRAPTSRSWGTRATTSGSPARACNQMHYMLYDELCALHRIFEKYLRAKLEITEQNRRLRAGDHHDDKHDEQKREHRIHLMSPVTKESKHISAVLYKCTLLRAISTCTVQFSVINTYKWSSVCILYHIIPDWIQDEEHLDEDAAEGQHASHKDSRHSLRVERLLWDLPRNLVGAHRQIIYL